MNGGCLHHFLFAHSDFILYTVPASQTMDATSRRRISNALMIAQRIHNFLARQSRSTSLFISLVLLAIVALIDYTLTAQQAPFLVLFLLPIVTATWFGGGAIGMAFAIASCAINLIIDFLLIESYPNISALYWKNITAILIYPVTARLLSTLRIQMEREKQLARTDDITGAPNRRAFFEVADIELHRA